jgi:hypothetical protein
MPRRKRPDFFPPTPKTCVDPHVVSSTNGEYMQTSSIVAYMAPDPYIAPPPAVTIPSPPPFTIGPTPDPFDFLRPLLALNVDPITACRLYAKFGVGAVAVVGLANLVEVTVDELVADEKKYEEAVNALWELAKK